MVAPAAMQRLEIRKAVISAHHHLAIDQELPGSSVKLVATPSKKRRSKRMFTASRNKFAAVL
jgi:hypothetical protein